MSESHNRRPDTIGLALGGGGVWSLAHPGVLDVYRQIGGRVHAVAGASGGALFGAVLAAHIDPETKKIRPEGIAYMRRIVLGIKTFEDFRERVGGEVRMDVHRLLNPGGNDQNYRSMMRHGTTVPFSAQVARKNEKGWEKSVLLHQEPGGNMERALAMAAASSANGPMLGFTPVEFEGQLLKDDPTVSLKSTSALARYLEEQGHKSLSVALSFADSSARVRQLLDFFLPKNAYLGEVVIRPKMGHQALDGSASITNRKIGWALPGMGKKFALTAKELAEGSRIAIPGEAFLQAGEEAARRELPRMQEMLK